MRAGRFHVFTIIRGIDRQNPTYLTMYCLLQEFAVPFLTKG